MTATIIIYENEYARVWATSDRLGPDLKCPICGHKLPIDELKGKVKAKLGDELFKYLDAVAKQKRKWLEIERRLEAKEIRSFAELKRLIADARARPPSPRFEGHVAGGDHIMVECDECGEIYHFSVNWRVDEQVFTQPQLNWINLIHDISELGDREAEKAFRRKFGTWFKEFREKALKNLEFYDQHDFWQLVMWLATDFGLGIPAIPPAGYSLPKREVELPAPLVSKVERFAEQNGVTLERALIILIRRGLELG